MSSVVFLLYSIGACGSESYVPPRLPLDATLPRATSAGARLQLLIVELHQSCVHDLPARGEVCLGRGDCDVVLTDRTVSRQHAVLRVGEVLTLEDTGSSHGTWLHGARLTPGNPARLAVGDAFRLGERVHGILQARMHSPDARRVRRHGYFEERLDDECVDDGRAFVLVRVSVERIEPWVEAEILELARPLDVVGQYGPGEYELLLLDLAPDSAGAAARAFAAQLTERFAARRNPARVGLAVYPQHGQKGAQLMAHACRALVPAAAQEAAPVVVSESMQILHGHLERYARHELRVLLLGETGVGKEVFARALRSLSPRRSGPFEAINCATLKDALAASELFGHKKGAFTGAVQDQKGLFDRVAGGAIFLDEIGELSGEAQAGLLRFLENGEVRPVGSSVTHKVDVWVIGATNRPLDAMRSDLGQRFPVKVTVPPLRERMEEVEPLARRFILDAARDRHRDPPSLSAAAVAALLAHAWPGNVRELKNEIVRAIALCDGTAVLPEHFSFVSGSSRATAPPAESARELELAAVCRRSVPPAPPGLSLDELDERHRMLVALIEHHWNQSLAAEAVHLVRERFCEKMRRYGISGKARSVRPKRGP